MINKFNKELDIALRSFIKEPDNFLNSLTLVNSLHSFPVLASDQPYAIALDGQKVTPVFTDADDLKLFRAQQTSARNQNWIERTSLEVLQEAIANRLNGLVYNIKRTGDFGNSTIFKTSEMVEFINNYTSILNKVFNEDNQEAAILDRYYLVPAFINPKENGDFDKGFPTMSNPDGESYIPVFSNLPSFVKWYHDQEFGLPFREAQGVIMTWKIEDIQESETKDSTLGIVINPFDDKQIVVEWSGLN
ncbi:SseB family protein [Streptococcus macacae]|uniref:SseB protein N-terminal domain-containing protein n=1 Tax=Streptococcus macacae NCTC 11558 TaxID=764298 RepID=G5JV45_9STRE|nr:SseB family protein [Streptococcus macacae]EHJ53261.1 hypothetical protein STRMA_1754 [Streptococcus macacae NCTC 11558]SUN77671.1 Uncharacterised protein [Streptococcus macacae NCTC 11558]